jgi:acetolactate synthase-1/2/3 large subunit
MAPTLGEMGPGSLNLAAGAGVAFNNNLAVLLVTTNQHRAAAYPHAGMFMDLDAASLFKPITKWNAVVNDPRRMPDLVRRAFREMLSGRPGPVHLDIPQDVLSASCEMSDDQLDLPPSRYRLMAGPRPAPQLVQAAADLLRSARRPLIVAGGGVVASGAEAATLVLAQRLHAPVVATQMALGLVPTDSPHFIGHGGIIGGMRCMRVSRPPMSSCRSAAGSRLGCGTNAARWRGAGISSSMSMSTLPRSVHRPCTTSRSRRMPISLLSISWMRFRAMPVLPWRRIG